jgi:hypothetical protein
MTIQTITKTLDYATDLQTGSASAPLPPSSEQREPEGEFGRFEDLAHKLVNVPKRELDERRRGES